MPTTVLTKLAIASFSLVLAQTFHSFANENRREDFATKPTTRTWRIFGDTNLFHWHGAHQQLEVTWDSSRPNTFFELPLGTVLTRRDDFSVELDLLLQDIAIGVTPGKAGTFQIAFGFLNRKSAHRPDFIRGTGRNSPNLVEFNFLPDSGYGPTVWPAIFGTNGMMNYSGTTDFSKFELPLDILMRIRLGFSSSNQAAALSITTNGVLVGPVTTAVIAATVPAFYLDTFAISSYSDSGQGSFAPGSILAHGSVDNIFLQLPPAPVRQFTGTFETERWRGTFQSRTNWLYTLEGSEDLVTWQSLSITTEGTGDFMVVEDSDVNPRRFYRINASPKPAL